MKIPFNRDELDAAQKESVRKNRLDSCYLRPLVFYGSEAMGVAAKSNTVRVSIAAWPWGAYLGADAPREGHPCEDLVIHPPSSEHHDVQRESRYATTLSILANQEATHDGYDEAMLLDPQGFFCRGIGRERVHRARRQAAHARPFRRRLNRHHPRHDHHARRANSASQSSSDESRATSSTSPTRRSSPGPPRKSRPSASSTTGRSAPASAARSPRSCRRCSSTSSMAATLSTWPG